MKSLKVELFIRLFGINQTMFKGTKNAYLFRIPFDKEIKMKFYIFPEWFHVSI